MDCMFHGVAKSWTRLNDFHFTSLHFTLENSGSDSKEFPCNAGDLGSTPGSGRFLGEGNDNSLQYSWAFLEPQLVKNLPAMWETWV